MPSHELFPCRVVTPEGIAFDGEAQFVQVTGRAGEFGARARHAPIVADLKMGHVHLQVEDDEWKKFATLEGFIKVHDSSALVLVEEAVPYESITDEMASAILAGGEEELERARAEAAKAAERAKQVEVDDEDEDEVFRADVIKAETAVAWGEHLKQIASGKQESRS